MKKLFSVLMLTLAINFLAVAGGVGYLYKIGKLDKDKIHAIKEMIFPPPQADVPTTQPTASDATTQPTLKLDELLAKAAGRTAGEQVEFIQQSFDAQMAQLDQRYRELQNFRRQTDIAQAQLAKDRNTLAADRKQLADRQQLATRLASDKGFQDSLQLYNTMPAKQVKTIFMTLNDEIVQQYLQAMQPRTASKIVKEFKATEEVERIQRVLEKMRKAELAAKE